MKGLFFAALAVFIFGACNTDKKSSGIEELPLKTNKDRISYVIGADHAQQVVKDPNFEKYNKGEILKGFDLGYANPGSFDKACEMEIQSLFGPDNTGFNEAHNDKASLAIGKLLGSVFKNGWQKAGALNELNFKYVHYGFELALAKADTMIEASERKQILESFMMKVNQKMMVEVEKREGIFFHEVKAIPGIKELPQGLYLETIKEGTGGSPAISDDVKAHYVLMSDQGDTIQSSLNGGQQIPVFNLSAVIPGWTVGIPFMKKGGKYKLYVPQSMGYGGQSPDPSIPQFATLVFYVELIDFGKTGTLK